ncbi:MAG: hypothetical protein GKR86_00020 [Ilumatobacter sp.]|nr:hypothetical protein [Ilumatobacter sp.]
MTNDVKAIENKLVAAFGSGRVATRHLAELMQAAYDQDSGNNVASALGRMHKQGDSNAVGVITKVFKAVFPDGKCGVNKKTGQASVSLGKVADRTGNNQALIGLHDAAFRNLNCRGKAFNEAVFGKKEKADPRDTFKRAVMQAKKAGITDQDMIKVIAAAFHA